MRGEEDERGKGGGRGRRAGKGGRKKSGERGGGRRGGEKSGKIGRRGEKRMIECSIMLAMYTISFFLIPP